MTSTFSVFGAGTDWLVTFGIEHLITFNVQFFLMVSCFTGRKSYSLVLVFIFEYKYLFRNEMLRVLASCPFSLCVK